MAAHPPHHLGSDPQQVAKRPPKSHAKPTATAPSFPKGATPPPPAPPPPLLAPANAHDASPTLSPNDHLRLLLELLRPAGAELARRWLAALLMAPREEREAIVQAIELRMLETYQNDAEDDDRPARRTR